MKYVARREPHDRAGQLRAKRLNPGLGGALESTAVKTVAHQLSDLWHHAVLCVECCDALRRKMFFESVEDGLAEHFLLKAVVGQERRISRSVINKGGQLPAVAHDYPTARPAHRHKRLGGSSL